MKKLLLSLSAAVTCMGMSAAVPVLKEQYKGSVNVTPETVTYSNPSTYDAQATSSSPDHSKRISHLQARKCLVKA